MRRSLASLAPILAALLAAGCAGWWRDLGAAEAFTFRAASPGAAHLTFEWRRQPGPPAETFELDVNVAPRSSAPGAP